MLKSEEWSFHSLWRVGAVGAPRRFIKSKVNQKILELFLLRADDELFAYGWFADRVIAGLTRLAWIPGRIYQSNLDVSNTSADAPWPDQLHTPLHRYSNSVNGASTEYWVYKWNETGHVSIVKPSFEWS